MLLSAIILCVAALVSVGQAAMGGFVYPTGSVPAVTTGSGGDSATSSPVSIIASATATRQTVTAKVTHTTTVTSSEDLQHRQDGQWTASTTSYVPATGVAALPTPTASTDTTYKGDHTGFRIFAVVASLIAGAGVVGIVIFATCKYRRRRQAAKIADVEASRGVQHES
jgi:hypothetical protein